MKLNSSVSEFECNRSKGSNDVYTSEKSVGEDSVDLKQLRRALISKVPLEVRELERKSI